MRARLSMVLLAAAVLAAQEHMPHDHGAVTGLGTLHFPISCSAAAQAKFTRAVAWLHSFGYEQAEALFSQIGANEPECGMAYWGAAMTLYHPIWAPPSRAELARGAEASAKATQAGAKTARERDYIAAIATFYQDSTTAPYRKRGEA